MYNWSVDLKNWKKRDEQFIIWKLNQLINFGLGKKKLDLKLVKKYWDKLTLDPYYRKYLKFLLWPKQS